jgi:hypothetical protein
MKIEGGAFRFAGSGRGLTGRGGWLTMACRGGTRPSLDAF